MKRKSYTNRDSRNVKDELLGMIPALTDKWTDFHESDAGMVLIDLMAYLADQKSYYLDRMALESNYTTAYERKNVFSNLRPLGYQLHGYWSAETTVYLRSSHTYDIYLNQYDMFSTEEDDGDVFYFSIMEDITIPPNAAELIEVPLMEGVRKEFYFDYEDISEFQSLKLPNEKIAENSVRLFIDDEEWDRVDDVYFYEDLDTVFSVEQSRDGYPLIRLLSGWEELILEPENINIKIIGLESNGADANIGSGTIVKLISEIEDEIGDTDCTSTISDIIHRDTISGGVNPETIEEARELAPKRLRTLWSVVTLRDYEDFCMTEPRFSNSLALDWSIEGSGIDDPYYVKLIVVPEESKYSSQAVKDALYIKLMERRVSPVKVEILDPDYYDIDIEISVYVKPSYDQPGYLKIKIRDALDEFFDPSNRDFGETIKPASIRYYIESNINEIEMADMVTPLESILLEKSQFPYLNDIKINIVEEEL
jgi:hypothetical protein